MIDPEEKDDASGGMTSGDIGEIIDIYGPTTGN